MAKETELSQVEHLKAAIGAEGLNPNTVVGGPILLWALKTEGKITSATHSTLSRLRDEQPTLFRKVDAALRVTKNLADQRTRANGNR